MSQKRLIVGPSWVGDMVMAQSLFMLLKDQQPDSYLAVLAPAWSQALLARMPQVDEILVMPAGHGQLQLGMRWRLGRELKHKRFDQAIILPGSLKSALVPAFAGIPKRTGFIGEQRYGLLNDYRRLDKQALPLNVQRFLALGNADHQRPDHIPEPALSINEAAQQSLRQQHAIDSERPLLVLCPGAEFGPAKQWPAQHYAELAKHKHAAGWQVALLGSEADQPVCREINAGSAGACLDLSGGTTLTEAMDVISMADFVVSNDSGLMHVAAAYQRPLVAIYGSSSPDFTPPLSKNCEMLRLQLDCQPCFKRECPLGHMNCLQALLPEQVLRLMPE